MKRRSFLASILAAGVAPAAVGSGILMPVRKLVVPPLEPLPLSVIDQVAMRARRSSMSAAQAEHNAQMLRQLTNLIVLGVSAVDGQGRDVSRQLWFDANGVPHIKPQPLIFPAGTRIDRIAVDSVAATASLDFGVSVGRQPWRA